MSRKHESTDNGGNCDQTKSLCRQTDDKNEKIRKGFESA